MELWIHDAASSEDPLWRHTVSICPSLVMFNSATCSRCCTLSLLSNSFVRRQFLRPGKYPAPHQDTPLDTVSINDSWSNAYHDGYRMIFLNPALSTFTIWRWTCYFKSLPFAPIIRTYSWIPHWFLFIPVLNCLDAHVVLSLCNETPFRLLLAAGQHGPPAPFFFFWTFVTLWHNNEPGAPADCPSQLGNKPFSTRPWLLLVANGTF